MLVLDVETQNSFDADYAFDTKELKISYTGIIDSETKEEMDFWEDDMEKMGKLLESADLICGYNLISFDMPVIANYLGDQINELPVLDLMVAAQKSIGFRPKLDSLTSATFGEGKIGKGSDAVRYYASGELDKLKEYCLEDVRLTLKLFEFGRANGFIKYHDKDGFIKQANIDWEKGKKVPKPKDESLSLF